MIAISRLSASEQARAAQVDEQRRASFDRLWTKEEEEGQSWFTVDTKNPDSLDGAVNSLMKESERLVGVEDELEEFDDLSELYRRGWMAANEKNQEELEKILDQMDQAEVSEIYINKLIDLFDPTINNPPVSEEEAMEKKAMEKETMEKEVMEKP